jgi:DNA gyrase subunit A
MFAIAATSDGFALAFGLSSFVEPSTRAGRRFAKLSEGCSIIGVDWALARRKSRVICISRKSRVLVCAASEISYLSGPGRGVVLMKLDDGDQLMGIKVANNPEDALVVKTTLGGEQKITLARHDTSARGGKGRDLIKRGQISEVLQPAPVAPQLSDPTDS